jgi:hypothetical protein
MSIRHLIAFVALSVSSYPAIAKEKAIDIEALDVAGVKLGMTPAEARAALIAAAYSVSDDQMGPSWMASVSEEAGKYANTPRYTTQSVIYTRAEAPDFQKIEVSYQVGPEGSRVRKVEYSRPADRGDIRPTAMEKYGDPTVYSINGFRYCPTKAVCPNSFMAQAPEASIEVHQSMTGRSYIILSQGGVTDLHHEIAFKKAVRDIAPNYGKAAF